MQKIITVVGGSGFIGRHLVQALCREGYMVRVICRDTVEGAYVKTCGQVGQVVLQHGDITKPQTLAGAFAGSYGVVNLVGILQQSGRQKFKTVQADGARHVAEAAKAAGAERFVQISAIGADRAHDSQYASSKLAGEQAVRAVYPNAVILRPSLVVGPEDGFFQRFGRMAMNIGVLPLIGSGTTRFQPLYVLDVVEAILASLTRNDVQGQTYELGGPDVFTLKDLLSLIGKTTTRCVCVIRIPSCIASFKAFFLELLPIRAPFTRDQVRLLKYDNVVAEDAKGFRALNINPVAITSVLPTLLARFMKL